MKQFFHFFILIALIAGVLFLDNYFSKETDFMNEMVGIHADILSQDVWQFHERAEWLSKQCSSREAHISSDLKYLEQFNDTSSPVLSIEDLNDSLETNFSIEPRRNIWPSVDKLQRLQIKGYVRDWLEVALMYIPDTCDIAGDDDLELLVPSLKIENDSIYFIAVFGYQIDSPYYDPISGYKIDSSSIRTIQQWR